jgi:hypothetical protein
VNGECQKARQNLEKKREMKAEGEKFECSSVECFAERVGSGRRREL